MRARAEAVLRGAAAAQDVEVEIKIAGRSTTAVFDQDFAERMASTLADLDGVAVNATSHLASGSEDATFFMRRVQERGGQALYAVVGSDISSGHHTPTFDIDEADMVWAIEALATGIVGLGEGA